VSREVLTQTGCVLLTESGRVLLTASGCVPWEELVESESGPALPEIPVESGRGVCKVRLVSGCVLGCVLSEAGRA